MSSKLLDRLYAFARELPRLLEEDVRSVVVFGSAARSEDFVPGLSDLDVLVLVEGLPRRRYYYFDVEGHEVNVAVYTFDELLALYSVGDPLAHMLRLSLVVYDSGLAEALPAEAEVTGHTLRALRRSIFAALGLAVEKYFAGFYREAVSHVYHLARHVIRYDCALHGKQFPVSDAEVKAAASGDLEALFLLSFETRKREVTRTEAASLIERAIDVLCRYLGLKPTTLRQLEAAVWGDAMTVVACEETGSLVFKVERYSESGLKILKVRGEEAEDLTY